MTSIKNSLTNFLDERLPTMEDVEDFLDNLEDEVLGISNREFFLMYKGDIKELNEEYGQSAKELAFEKELLKGLVAYAKQRQINQI